MTLIAGKKYNYTPVYGSKYNGVIYECLKITQHGLAVMFGDGCPFIVPIKEFDRYTEHKELRKGTFWINVYDSYTSAGHKTKDRADQAAPFNYRIACVEVPWIEGQGLEKGED